MSSKGKPGVLLGFGLMNRKKNSGAGNSRISGGDQFIMNTGSNCGRNEYYGDYGWDRNVWFPKMVEDQTQKNLKKEKKNKNKNKKKKKSS